MVRLSFSNHELRDDVPLRQFCLLRQHSLQAVLHLAVLLSGNRRRASCNRRRPRDRLFTNHRAAVSDCDVDARAANSPVKNLLTSVSVGNPNVPGAIRAVRGTRLRDSPQDRDCSSAPSQGCTSTVGPSTLEIVRVIGSPPGPPHPAVTPAREKAKAPARTPRVFNSTATADLNYCLSRLACMEKRNSPVSASMKASL